MASTIVELGQCFHTVVYDVVDEAYPDLLSMRPTVASVVHLPVADPSTVPGFV